MNKKVLIISIVGVVIILVVVICLAYLQNYSKDSKVKIMNNNKNIKYGEVIAFKENEILQFNDFRISYLGKTSEKVNSNLSLTDYNFMVTAPDNREGALGWSSGTGEISPVSFVVGSKVYQLELKLSEKDNKQLAENEMIISLSKDTMARYLFALISKLSLLPEYDLPNFTKILGFSFKKEVDSNQYIDMFTSTGFGLVESAELRIGKEDAQKKLLILEIDPSSKILMGDILKKYPDGQMSVNEPNNPTRISLSVPKPWGKISFGFGPNNILTTIVLDSI